MGAVNGNLHLAALPSPLRLEFEGGEGMPLRAIVSGEIDYASAFSMQVRIAAACRRRQARGLILDLTGAEFMSSSGLASILSLQRELACRRGGMVLMKPTAEVLRIIRLTGLDERLIIADTAEEAELLLRRGAPGEDIGRTLSGASYN
jgi:anti-anti-sigma factor